MQNKRSEIYLLISILFFSYFFSPTVFAEEGESERELSVGDFTYEVIQPDNQIDKGVSYWNLRMKPGQKQQLTIQLRNLSEQELTVLISVNAAVTNSTGLVEYGPSMIKQGSSAKYSFKDLVKAPREIVLKPKEETKLTVNVTMPEQFFEGYIAGGIQLMKKDQYEDKSATIVNKFAYAVGVLLSEQEEKDLRALPEKLELKKVYFEEKDAQSAVIANYSNEQPIYVDDMTVEMQITQAENEKVLLETKKDKMRMAPNSEISFPLELGELDELPPGDYRARINVRSGKGGKWQWEEEFAVNGKTTSFSRKASGLDSVKGEPDKKRILLSIGLSIFASLLLIFLAIHFLRKTGARRNKK